MDGFGHFLNAQIKAVTLPPLHSSIKRMIFKAFIQGNRACWTYILRALRFRIGFLEVLVSVPWIRYNTSGNFDVKMAAR